MNNIIQDFAKQATDDVLGVKILDQKKFAKLIIEECASLFPQQFTDEQYQRRIDKTIRKHFGLIND
jgi:hypothetical protein